MMQQSFFGKYRGVVANNIDPLQLGRVQVTVPAVLGQGHLSWALPCAPYAGPQVGFFAIPPVGANIWVEFEGGDPNYPIWSGCFWGEGEVPADPAVPEMKVFKTDTMTLKMSDLPGTGVTLEVIAPAVEIPLKLTMGAQGIELSATPATIKMAPEGIELSFPPATVKISPQGIQLTLGAASVQLTPASVSINNGALEVI